MSQAISTTTTVDRVVGERPARRHEVEVAAEGTIERQALHDGVRIGEVRHRWTQAAGVATAQLWSWADVRPRVSA